MNTITVKDAILTAAAELGFADTVQAYFDGTSQEGEAEVEALLRCFQLVENELALDYLPLYAEEEVETGTGVVPYDAFSRTIVRIVKVTDEWGNDAPFTLFPEYLKTQGGKCKIRYAYAPEKKELDGESDYHLYVSARLLAYGMAMEYALARGMFEEASVWDKKYKDAITATYRANPCRVIRSRRWV